MIISNAKKKHLTKSKTHSLKALSKLGIEGNHLNLIKTLQKKSTANMIFNDEKLKALPLKSATKQGLSSLLIILEVLT